MFQQLTKRFVALFIAIVSVILVVDYFYSRIESKNVIEQEIGSFWQSLVKPVNSTDVSLNDIYQFVPLAQLAWPEAQIEELKSKGFLLIETGSNSYLFHGYVDTTEKVLITEVNIDSHSNSQWLWWLIIYGSLALVILWWLFPLISDVKKLQNAAIEFGKSKNYCPVPIKAQSAIFPIADALSQMTRRIQRLMSLQRDIATYALHDIRTPLSRIRFACELITEPESQELKSDIIEEIDEVEQLLKELLRYAEFEYTKPSMQINRVNLFELAEEVKKKFETISAINIENLISSDVEVNLEYKLFKRALMNLLSNCLRYAENNIWISFSTSEECVCLVVEDDGPGIDIDDLAYIKTPFMRVANSEDSNSGECNSGLGLAIVETICLWHGGEFKIGNSSKYHGARFVLQWNSQALKCS